MNFFNCSIWTDADCFGLYSNPVKLVKKPSSGCTGHWSVPSTTECTYLHSKFLRSRTSHKQGELTVHCWWWVMLEPKEALWQLVGESPLKQCQNSHPDGEYKSSEECNACQKVLVPGDVTCAGTVRQKEWVDRRRKGSVLTLVDLYFSPPRLSKVWSH